MGTVFVDNIKQQSSQGSGTITIGASGETVALASGVKQSNINYPAFDANMSDNQELANGTTTKLNFDEEVLDTNNFYDTSTYRFTPLVGGKYLVYAYAAFTGVSNSTLVECNVFLHKNGTAYAQNRCNLQSNPGNAMGLYISRIIEFNGSSDYVEAYGYINTNNSTERVMGTNDRFTGFGGYRIGT